MPNEPGANVRCSRCGSNDITFKRENRGEYSDGQTRQVLHRTVAVCNDCGNTWVTEQDTPVRTAPTYTVTQNGANWTVERAAPKQRNTFLWVLGWIFIFPVPLTILLLRKKDMNPYLKYGLIAAGWIAYFAIALFGRQ